MMACGTARRITRTESHGSGAATPSTGPDAMEEGTAFFFVHLSSGSPLFKKKSLLAFVAGALAPVLCAVLLSALIRRNQPDLYKEDTGIPVRQESASALASHWVQPFHTGTSNTGYVLQSNSRESSSTMQNPPFNHTQIQMALPDWTNTTSANKADHGKKGTEAEPKKPVAANKTQECIPNPMVHPECSIPEFTLIAQGDLESRLTQTCAAFAIRKGFREDGKEVSVRVLWKTDQEDPDSSYTAVLGSLSFVQDTAELEGYQNQGFWRPFQRTAYIPACESKLPWSQAIKVKTYVSPNQINFVTFSQSQACRLQGMFRRCFQIIKPSARVLKLVESEPELARLERTVAVYAQAPGKGEPCQGCKSLSQAETNEEKTKEDKTKEKRTKERTSQGGPMSIDGKLRQKAMELCLMRRLVMGMLRKKTAEYSMGSRVPSSFEAVTYFLEPERHPFMLNVSKEKVKQCRPWGKDDTLEGRDLSGWCLMLQAGELFGLSRAKGLVTTSMSSASAVLIAEQGRMRKAEMRDSVLKGMGAGSSGEGRALQGRHQQKGPMAKKAKTLTATDGVPGGSHSRSMAADGSPSRSTALPSATSFPHFTLQMPLCSADEIPPLTQQPFAQSLVLLPQLNLSLCANPMAGSGAWVEWIRKVMHQAHVGGKNVSAPGVVGFPVLARNFSESQATRILTRRSMFNVAPVRNPFLRVLAAYHRATTSTQNKSNASAIDDNWIGKYFGELKGAMVALKKVTRTEGYLPFKNFVSMVHLLWAQNKTLMHEDLMPQRETCGLNKIRYDVISTHGNVAATKRDLTSHFGPKALVPLLNGEDPEVSQHIKLLYDRESFTRVLEMYGGDMSVALNHIHMQVPEALQDVFENEEV